MPFVAGVDGCRNGWVVVLHDLESGARSARVLASFAELLMLSEQPTCVALDMPLGLDDVACKGGRVCDVQARRLLRGRTSSLFSPPSRAALKAWRNGGTYADVLAANRSTAPDAPGLSLQTYNLLPKISAIDARMTPALQTRIREAHPELAFCHRNGGVALLPKKSAAGIEQRMALLAAHGFAPNAVEQLFGARRPKGVQIDDVLDACVLCEVARTLFDGTALVLRDHSAPDARGLWREICA